MKKLITALLFVPALMVNAAQSDGVQLRKFTLPQGWVSNMSDNGKWATWVPYSYSETDCKVTILNIETGNLDELPITNDEQIDEDNVARMIDITNDGKMVVGFFNHMPGYYLDGEWHYLPMPADKRKWSGQVDCVSSDGSIMIGQLNKNWIELAECLWMRDEDGGYSLRNLAEMNMPGYEDFLSEGLLSRDIYDRIIKDNPDAKPSFSCRRMSGDGTWLVVSVSGADGFSGGSFLYDVKAGKPRYVDGKLQRSMSVSNNGKFVLLHGRYNEEDGENFGGYYYDLATGEKRPAPGGGGYFDNLGGMYTEVGAEATMGVRGSLCMPVDGVAVDLESVLRQKYGIDFKEATGYDSTGYVVGVSEDGKTLVAMAEMVLGAYSLTLPEPFVEAFRNINVLEEWTAGPTPGISLAHLSTVAVQLSRAASVKEDAVAVVKHNGEVMASSTGISVGNSSGRLFRIDFPLLTFEEGETYTVEIPEGTFYIPRTDSRTPLISFDYIGRADKPLAYSELTPAEGSAISDFSMTSAVGITFPTEIILGNPSGYPGIFEEGTDNPLARLGCTINGRMLIVYPEIALSLPQGLKYEIRIPANIVTDPTGYCGNEAFTLHYEGAYERKPGTGSFFEDFSQPNAALRSFIQYEGDHLKPSSAVTSFGFDADNTPWNFSLRDDDEYDYCAASHSMYAPSGKSDDWMVIPNFRVQGESTFLSFKGQSWLKAKADKLKVVVWECEQRYNSLSKAVVDRMKEEGKVVFEQRLSPGDFENILKNDWTEYRVPLGEFNDKYIYVAFVNENENQSMIFLDDIKIDNDGMIALGTLMPSNIIGADDVEVKAVVTSRNPDASFKKLKAEFTNLANGHKGSYEAEVDLAPGESLEFVFPERMKLEKGVANEYEVNVMLDDEGTGVSGILRNLTRELQKKVVIEETTGAWCGNCPMGVVAFEEIEKRHPGSLVAIAVHDQDQYQMMSYSTFLATGGDPTGRVNRSEKVVYPLPGMMLTSPTGDQSWYDLFQKELQQPAESEVRINRAIYSTAARKLQIDTEYEFALDQANLYYNVFTVVLEDALPIRQHNYFASSSYDNWTIMGEWLSTGELGSQGEYAETEANHVARGIAGLNFNGESGYIPRDVKAGEIYGDRVITLDLPSLREETPAEGERFKNVSVACVIINSATGNMINADICHEVEVTGEDISGISMIGEELSPEISFHVVHGKVAGPEGCEVEVYTVDGRRVANESLRGLYIVRCGSHTAKLLVR